MSRFRSSTIYLVIITSFIALALRVMSLSKELYYDEANFVQLSRFGIPFPHPFLSVLPYKIADAVLGDSVWIFRFISFIFFIANLLLVYAIARKLYNRKTAILSILLLMLSFWGFFMSNLIDHDGSTQLFSMLLTFLAYIHFREKTSTRNMVFMGLALSIAFLTKFSAVILIPIILADYSIKNFREKQLGKTLKIIYPIALTGIIVFFHFILLKRFWPKNFYYIFDHGSQLFIQPIPNPYVIVYFLLFATPLYFYSIFMAVRDRGLSKDQPILLWIFGFICVYGFSYTRSVIPSFDRYLMPILPAISILLAAYLNKARLNLKLLTYAAFFLIIIFNFIFIFYKPAMVPHNPASFFVQWRESDFLFPITSNSGPFVQIPFYLLIAVNTISLALVFIALLGYKKTLSISLFIAIGIAFNIILIEQYVFKLNYVDYDEAIREAKIILRSEISEPVYTNADAVSYYSEKKGIDSILFSYLSTDSIQANNGSVILVHALKIDPSTVEHMVAGCTIEKKLFTHDYLALEYYDCNKS